MQFVGVVCLEGLLNLYKKIITYNATEKCEKISR